MNAVRRVSNVIFYVDSMDVELSATWNVKVHDARLGLLVSTSQQAP